MTVFRKNPQMSFWLDGLVVDNFAGGGGASTGIEMALGRPVDIAINHDEIALSVHAVNHPHTKHYTESVFNVDPVEVTNGLPVKLVWLSPDCRHFSKAKGSVPVKKEIRGLAWVGLRWAVLKKPKTIILENVKEFRDWGPVESYFRWDLKKLQFVMEHRPVKSKKGETFALFVKKLERAGYVVEYKVLVAADYGAPTSRERFFMICKREGEIVWPKPTHAPIKSAGIKRHRPASECIDWTIPAPSIFDRKKPLAENTQRRIAKGLQKFVVNNPSPFIVEIAHYSKSGKNERVHSINEPLRTITASPKGGSFALCVPFFDRQFGNGVCSSADKPLKTITAQGMGKSALVTAWIAKHYTGVTGSSLNDPLHTITQKDHNALVAAFLIKYYGCSNAASLDSPIDTITTKDRLGLVTINSENYRIVDIGMRMLSPKELYKAQSFPDDFIFSHDAKGRKITKTKQVAMCGNSVPPELARALVAANVEVV